MLLTVEIVQFLSAAALGLFVGALLTEAVVLVPMWRSLRPAEFFLLHSTHAHRLYSYFAPLTAGAVCLAVIAAVATVLVGHPGRLAAVVAAALALIILSTYFLYFQRANASFAEATIKPEDLPVELERWASWHWFRTAVGIIALAFTLLSLRSVA